MEGKQLSFKESMKLTESVSVWNCSRRTSKVTGIEEVVLEGKLSNRKDIVVELICKGQRNYDIRVLYGELEINGYYDKDDPDYSGKISTVERLYLSIKGKLEANIADRLRERYEL